MLPSQAFPRNVRQVLEERGKSQNDLARDLEMDPGNLSRVLNGLEAVTLQRAERIAASLQLPLTVLISDPMPSPELAVRQALGAAMRKKGRI